MRRLGVGLGVVMAMTWMPAAATAQTAPVQVAPAGLVEGSSQTYAWRAVPGAGWYELFISDSVSAPVHDEWYTAAQAGCGEGTGICRVTVSLDLAEGQVAWWVRGYFASGSGPWSGVATLHVRRTPGAWSLPLPVALRFQLVLGGEAVLDRETGLVWQRAMSTATGSFELGVTRCLIATTGGRRGWRLPTQAEIGSLGGEGGGLPDGHPFTLVPTAYVWSQSPYGTTTNYLSARLPNLDWTQQTPATTNFTWCVRGATGADR